MDDDEAEDSRSEDVDGEREPLPHDDDDRFEIGFVEDEMTQISVVREHAAGDEAELRDFNFVLP